MPKTYIEKTVEEMKEKYFFIDKDGLMYANTSPELHWIMADFLIRSED